MAEVQQIELVEAVVRELEARFGPGIVYRLSRARPKVGAAALSSGSLGLDRASGVGGVPRGALTLYLGGDSSGKTTLAYHLLAEAQRDDGLAALIDGEGAADPAALAAIGVDLDDLVLGSPRDATEALEMVEVLARCRAFDAIVATALPAARPDLLDRALRRLNSWLKGGPSAVALVGAVRSRYPAPSSPWSRVAPPAPSPLAFFASLIVNFEQERPLFGPGGDLVGLRTRALVTKNRLAAPGGLAALELRRGGGLNRVTEVLELGLALGLIERNRQGLVWRQTWLGRSLAAARATLETEPRLVAAIARSLDEP